MPDAYLHIQTAERAAAASGVLPACPAAFALGAQGPDPLFAYGLFRKNRTFLGAQTLGELLHSRQTGAFLTALATLALDDAQRSFAAGFACHAALDRTFHPYVAALCGADGPWKVPGGHQKLEAALDTAAWRQAGHGRFSAPAAADTAPACPPAQLADICALLRRAVTQVYGQTPDLVQLADCYTLFRLYRRFVRTPLGGKRLLAFAGDALVRRSGAVTGRMVPRRLACPLPQEWTDPFTGACHTGGNTALEQCAEQAAARALSALAAFWAGQSDRETLTAAVGGADYMTGLAQSGH